MPVLPNTTSAESAGTSSASSDTNTVAWQTAFWALSTLALNTVLQEPGNIKRLPAKVPALLASSGRLLRLFPIFCLLDTFHVVFYVACGLRIGLSLEQSLRLVAKHRFCDDLEVNRPNETEVLTSNDGDRTDLAASNAVSQAWTRPNHAHMLRFLFGLGALLQLIKLMGLRGIPWTQVGGMAFFSSFFVVEILQIFASGQYSLLNETTCDRISNLWKLVDGYMDQLQVLGVILRTLFWVRVCFLYTTKNAMNTDLYYLKFGQHQEYHFHGPGDVQRIGFALLLALVGGCTLYIGIVVLIPLMLCHYILNDIARALYVGPGSMFKFRTENLSKPELEPLIVSLFFVTATMSIILYWDSLSVYVWGDTMRFILCYLGSWMWAVYVLVFGVGVGLCLVALTTHLADLMVQFICKYFVNLSIESISHSPVEITRRYHATVIDLGTMIFYYSVLYDRQGTIKPDWIESLGKV